MYDFILASEKGLRDKSGLFFNIDIESGWNELFKGVFLALAGQSGKDFKQVEKINVEVMLLWLNIAAKFWDGVEKAHNWLKVLLKALYVIVASYVSEIHVTGLKKS